MQVRGLKFRPFIGRQAAGGPGATPPVSSVRNPAPSA